MKINKYNLLITYILLLGALTNAQSDHQIVESSYMTNEKSVTPDSFVLDGTWNHNNISDNWDGSEIKQAKPGGISSITEVDTFFIRLQDTGNPLNFGYSNPNNDKVCLTHAISESDINNTGITLSFRARIPVSEILDSLYLVNRIAYPNANGDGFTVDDNGRGMIFICMNGSSDIVRNLISFSLITTFDDSRISSSAYGEGLIMNSKVGNASRIGVGSPQGTDGSVNNLLKLNPRNWHDFWIKIRRDPDNVGTHLVTIWKDGERDSSIYHITAGVSAISEYELSSPYIAIGSSSIDNSGTTDIDYISYKAGLYSPKFESSGATEVIPLDCQDLSIYPNPTTDKVTIKFHSKISRISLFDITGSLLKVFDFDTDEPIIDLIGFKKGIYMLNIRAELFNGTYKILKN